MCNLFLHEWLHNFLLHRHNGFHKWEFAGSHFRFLNSGFFHSFLPYQEHDKVQKTAFLFVPVLGDKGVNLIAFGNIVRIACKKNNLDGIVFFSEGFG